MKENMKEDLLIRYILEETNVDERNRVEAWIKASDDHAKHFEQTKFLLDSSKRLAQKSSLNEQEAWDKFKLKRDAAKPVSMRTMNSTYRWVQAAAAILVLAVGAWAAWHYTRPQAKWITLTAYNKVLADTLPDGSVIHLNKHSSVSYYTNFKSNRLIKLKGEAFFKVIHNARMPFNVQVKDINISDVGTAFNVHENAGYIEVIVESGAVRVSRQASVIELKQMQMVRVDPGSAALKMEKNNDLLYQYYRTDEFVADHTPLSRLVEILNEAYGAHIKIRGKDVADLPITASLKKESLDKVLQVIMLTTPEIHRVNQGDEIILTR
jgi:transmembrane sensor